jgi:hypothetical protein
LDEQDTSEGFESAAEADANEAVPEREEKGRDEKHEERSHVKRSHVERRPARRARHHAPREAPQREESEVFTPGFLRAVIVALGIILIAGAYLLGYYVAASKAVVTTTTTPTAVIPPSQAAAPTQQAAPPAPNVPKADKPSVELFVMSYCPYGIQMEKAFVPAAKLLGGKADLSVKWVSYAMHGLKEVQENVRQYCIQKEQPTKYLDYLSCFVASTNSTACQQQAGIDSTKLQSCYDATDKQYGVMASYNDTSSWLSGQFPQFNIDKQLNDKYGVQGSPTLVINGQEVSTSRSSDAVKQAICAAFNTPPIECQTALRATQEAAGPGLIGAGTDPNAAAAGCGS